MMVREKQRLIASSLVSPPAAPWQEGREGASDDHSSNTVHVTECSFFTPVNSLNLHRNAVE